MADIGLPSSEGRQAALRLEVRIDKGVARRWQLDLLNTLARKPGICPRVRWADTVGPAVPDTLSLLFGLERALDRVPRNFPASRVDAAAFSRYVDEGSETPDRVLDFCGPLEERPTPTWFVVTEGSFGDTGALGALLAGRPPLVQIVDAADWHVLAAARPGTERGNAILTAYGDCLHRTATLVTAALDGAVSCLPAYSELADPRPSVGNAAVGRFLAEMAARRLKRGLYHSLCRAPHWRVGWRYVDGLGIVDALDLPETTWHELPDDGHHFYADPFPITYRDRTYLFVEDFDHRLGRAVISAVEFGDGGPLGAPMPVLSSEVHLSYPFVFEEDDEMWMVPESSGAGTIDLYRATRFPSGWQHEVTLVSGVEASDATLFQSGGRWWMVATVRDRGGSYSDALHLWSARSFRGPWTPHRKNPILIDIAAARPAGRVVVRGERLIRPVQDCRRGYGAALALAEITRLDDDRFEQSIVSVLEPGKSWPGRRLHTVNRAGRLECIDGSAISFKAAPVAALNRAGALGRTLRRRVGDLMRRQMWSQGVPIDRPMTPTKRVWAGLAACAWLALALSTTSRAHTLPVIAAEDFKNAGLRGFDLGANTELSNQDLGDMRRHGANVARFFVAANRVVGTDTYTLSLASLEAADRYARHGAAAGFRVVIVLDPLPNEWKQEYWRNVGLRASIVQMWKQLAARYRGDGAIAGYDLINEPIATADGSIAGARSTEGSNLWGRFALEIIDAIRGIDPDHAIIFEPSPGALPAAFRNLASPLPRSNIVYSTHMYEPHRLTHQGIYYAQSIVYAGASGPSSTLGIANIASSLAPVRSFAARTGVPIFVGEFSIVRWAPERSSIEYLSDLLHIVDDEEKWSWAYHAWRECECWDAEIPTSFYHQFPYVNAKPVMPPTVQPRRHRDPSSDAIRLLDEYLARSQRGP